MLRKKGSLDQDQPLTLSNAGVFDGNYAWTLDVWQLRRGQVRHGRGAMTG
jgi:hypothetical protein